MIGYNGHVGYRQATIFGAMSNFRARLTDVRNKAKRLISEGHVSSDISSTVEELLGVLHELERQVGSTDGQSADNRVLRSRIDHLSAEVKRKETELNSFKRNFLDIVITDIRNITGEVAKMHAPDASEETIQQGIKTISQALRHMVERLTKV